MTLSLVDITRKRSVEREKKKKIPMGGIEATIREC